MKGGKAHVRAAPRQAPWRQASGRALSSPFNDEDTEARDSSDRSEANGAVSGLEPTVDRACRRASLPPRRARRH